MGCEFRPYNAGELQATNHICGYGDPAPLPGRLAVVPVATGPLELPVGGDEGSMRLSAPLGPVIIQVEVTAVDADDGLPRGMHRPGHACCLM